MLQATFRPLTQWPGKRTPDWERRRAPFKAGYARTLDDIEREIGKLSGKSIVIQIDVEPRDIRNDGWPRSSARPKSPGVVVSFASTKGNLSFACDTYTAWEDNLRAIGLTMESLRAVDRYGATQGNEQYRGFAQIEAPAAIALDAVAAADFIGSHSGFIGIELLADVKLLEFAYRKALKKLHPDVGGSHDLFCRLQEARKVLGI
jgi:hypothetical protein